MTGLPFHRRLAVGAATALFVVGDVATLGFITLGFEMVASRILTHARTPVLAVPDRFATLRFRRPLIAWDGQAAAARTMRACVPLRRFWKD